MMGRRRGKVGGPQGGLPLLSLLLFLLLFTTVAAKIVESLWDGFGYYYKIYGYAMNNSADYQMMQVNNSCECRRRCQVVPECSSVSVVTLAGSNRAECRFSTKPTPLSNVNDRPKLSFFPASFHFLFTGIYSNNYYYNYLSTLWKSVEDDGFTYTPTTFTFSWGSPPSWCNKVVTITTLDQMRIIMKTASKNTPYNVDLYRGPNSQPTWNHQEAAIPYNQTELDPARIVDNMPLHLSSKFYLQHNGSQYTFIGGSGTPYTVLCQLNPLNLAQ
ncbi:uncharacterized protein [Cherax quadricarinatus]|uniref:uncharacterized protein n=1 Tax=Cherax quadricarinatus TaxID=27406 RepID=UPI00387EBE28